MLPIRSRASKDSALDEGNETHPVLRGQHPEVGSSVLINKVAASLEAAVAGIKDGSTIMIGGLGTAGLPAELIDALIAQGATAHGRQCQD